MAYQDLESLQRIRDQLRTKLAQVGDMQPGSLVRRHRKCGKPTCRCARKDDPGHEDWIITRAAGKKTVTRSIPKSALEETRQQIAEYRRFRELVKQFTEINSSICEAKLKARREEERGKKNTSSRRNSRKRSQRKSRS